MTISDFVLHSLAYGLGMSILLGTLVVATQLLNAEMWLDDYPAEIRERFGQMSGKAKRQKGIVSIFFLAAAFLPIIASLIHLHNRMDAPLGFCMVFWNVFIIVATFNLFDLLILDWLIFATLTPNFLVLPSTAGHPAYQDYAFHARGFVKGLGIAVILSVFTAALVLLF